MNNGKLGVVAGVEAASRKEKLRRNYGWDCHNDLCYHQTPTRSIPASIFASVRHCYPYYCASYFVLVYTTSPPNFPCVCLHWITPTNTKLYTCVNESVGDRISFPRTLFHEFSLRICLYIHIYIYDAYTFAYLYSYLHTLRITSSGNHSHTLRNVNCYIVSCYIWISFQMSLWKLTHMGLTPILPIPATARNMNLKTESWSKIYLQIVPIFN